MGYRPQAIEVSETAACSEFPNRLKLVAGSEATEHTCLGIASPTPCTLARCDVFVLDQVSNMSTKKKLDPEQWGVLNAVAERAADHIESRDFPSDGTTYYREDEMPPLVALKVAAIQRAAINREITLLAAKAHEAGESWNKIGAVLMITPEHAQRKYAAA